VGREDTAVTERARAELKRALHPPDDATGGQIASSLLYERTHTTDMRDRLNREIKYRESFRPFAPVVPLEAAARYFDVPPGGMRLARFMSGVFPVRREWQSRLQAITHVDGTARLQALEQQMAPRLYALLEAYGRRSGMPVLLNTSFNLAGEPIVNRAVEGYSTFLRCGIDVLIAGRTRVVKRASPMAETPASESEKEVA
jgi:carbamoyltransferase